MPASAASDDASWGRCPDRIGLCADYRKGRTISVREAIAAYLGLVPLEDSSGERRRLGHITKHGNSLLRFLLVEAAQATTRTTPAWRSKYIHLTMRRGKKIAKVAMARKLAIRLFWMMRQGWNYQQVMKFGSHVGQPGNRDGVR